MSPAWAAQKETERMPEETPLMRALNRALNSVAGMGEQSLRLVKRIVESIKSEDDAKLLNEALDELERED